MNGKLFYNCQNQKRHTPYDEEQEQIRGQEGKDVKKVQTGSSSQER
jgi:hypothetical protein